MFQMQRWMDRSAGRLMTHIILEWRGVVRGACLLPTHLASVIARLGMTPPARIRSGQGMERSSMLGFSHPFSWYWIHQWVEDMRWVPSTEQGQDDRVPQKWLGRTQRFSRVAHRCVSDSAGRAWPCMERLSTGPRCVEDRRLEMEISTCESKL